MTRRASLGNVGEDSPDGLQKPVAIPHVGLQVGALRPFVPRVNEDQRVRVPLLGVGGVSSAEDALQYLVAGASLVGIGTSMLRDPRTPERVLRELRRWCEANGVRRIQDVVGTLELGT